MARKNPGGTSWCEGSLAEGGLSHVNAPPFGEEPSENSSWQPKADNEEVS